MDFSELSAVDIGFGAFVCGAFAGLAGNHGPDQYRAFLSRPPERQVYRSEAEEINDFMSSVVGGEKTNTVDADGTISRGPELPVVYYYRKPGLTNGDDRSGFRPVHASNNDTLYKLQFLPVVVEYNLRFLAWDKPTLDKIQLAWYAYMTRTNRFEIKYRVKDELFDEIKGIIRENDELLLSDISLPKGEKRLWAVGTTVPVNTQVLFGEDVTVPESITVEGRRAGYCGFPGTFDYGD